MSEPQEYTRADFREWLESLPPDHSCGDEDQCPISMFTGLSNATSARADPQFAYEMDKAAVCNGEWLRGWGSIKASDALKVLDRLESAAEDRQATDG